MSAVSMDEEMSNMMKYQHAYNASTRVINAVDSMTIQSSIVWVWLEDSKGLERNDIVSSGF